MKTKYLLAIDKSDWMYDLIQTGSETVRLEMILNAARNWGTDIFKHRDEMGWDTEITVVYYDSNVEKKTFHSGVDYLHYLLDMPKNSMDREVSFKGVLQEIDNIVREKDAANLKVIWVMSK